MWTFLAVTATLFVAAGLYAMIYGVVDEIFFGADFAQIIFGLLWWALIVAVLTVSVSVINGG